MPSHPDRHVSLVRTLPLDSVALAQTIKQILPEWGLQEEQGIVRLVRQYHFTDFKAAWAFVNRLATLAEQENHHPKISLEWGLVGVQWWTHCATSLQHHDLICAMKTDHLFNTYDNQPL